MFNKKTMFCAWKTKDFVLASVLAVVFVVFFVLVKIVSLMLAGTLFVLIAAPITALLTSIIPLLLVKKCPKFGVLTVYTIVWGTVAFMYKPIITWFVLVLFCAFMADLILYWSKYTQLWLTGLAFGVAALGQSLGYVITVLFFWQWYKAMLTTSMKAEEIQSFLAMFSGLNLAITLVLPLIAGFVGTLFAQRIYNKHFGKALGNQDTVHNNTVNVRH